MFEELSRKLDGVLKRLRGQGKISEVNVAETLREVRRVLLDADVNYKVARQFVDDVTRRAVGQDVLQSVTPGQQIIKIIHDELVRLLGTANVGITFSPLPPTIIMVAGLQGSGKTTFCAKLANHLKGQGRFPLLAAADVHRPAAIDQLETLGAQIAVPVFARRGSDAVTTAREAVEHARQSARDVVIIDTAGRLHTQDDLMAELVKVERVIARKLPGAPHETLLVLDATVGQNALAQARIFSQALRLTGLVLAKLDSSARGGIVVALKEEFDLPVKLVGTGEGVEDMTWFDPERFARDVLAS